MKIKDMLKEDVLGEYKHIVLLTEGGCGDVMTIKYIPEEEDKHGDCGHFLWINEDDKDKGIHGSIQISNEDLDSLIRLLQSYRDFINKDVK